MDKAHTSVRALPDAPGVYLFMGPQRDVLYVGKATSLADRVKSYFAPDLSLTRGAHVVRMVQKAQRVDCRTTNSVLEAVILEAKLIKELKPAYNTRDKDDTSFHYLVITMHEEYPRLLDVRGKELKETLSKLKRSTPQRSVLPVYGPFPHAAQFKEVLKFIRRIFPYYDTKHPVTALRKKNDRKLRFNESIGVYPGADISRREYMRTVRHIKLLFDGKKPQLLRALERDIQRYAGRREFEQAAVAKRQLDALRHINDISFIRKAREERRAPYGWRVEGYDVAHLNGMDMVGVMAVLVDGEILRSQYRTFTVHSVGRSNDTRALSEVIARRLAHPEWKYPRLIVVDGGTAQLRAAQRVLKEAGVAVPVVAVTKDERHRPRTIQGPIKLRTEHHNDILLANAEAHRFSLSAHRRKRAKRLRR